MQTYTNGRYQNPVSEDKAEVDKAVIDVMESSAFINGKRYRILRLIFAAYLGVKHTAFPVPMEQMPCKLP